MVKYLLLPLLLLLTFLTKAQEKEDITGKWKVISANNGVLYNYKKDSLIITDKFRKLLIGQKDSIEK